MTTKKSSKATVFNGFPETGITFLAELRDNNTREWFQEHKDDYERYVKEPSELFLQEVSERLHDRLGVEFSGKIFRIHRDVRFSKDKAPYNCHIHMSFFPESGEKHDCGDKPAFHFGLEPDKVSIGTGCFEFSKDVLDRYRSDVVSADRGTQLGTIVNQLEHLQYRVSEAALKRVPAGYDLNHPRENLLRQKGFLVWYENKPDLNVWTTSAATDFLEQRIGELTPAYEWLLRLTE